MLGFVPVDPAVRYEAARALANDRRYREAEAALDEAAAALDEAEAALDAAAGAPAPAHEGGADAEASPAPDDDLRARIAGTRAYVLDQLGRPDEAEALCRATLAGETRMSAHTRGVVEGQLGTILLHRGRLDEADTWLGRAIATIPGDPLAVANVRMNRSLVGMQRRDLAAAAADLELAIAAFEAHGSAVDVAEARHNLGYTALLAGDLVRALREMGAARPVVAAASEANAAICDADMAEALRDAGLVTEAERLLRAAARAFSKNGMPQARAEAELHLAWSLLRHDPGEGAKIAAQAARHFDALGATAWGDRARGIRARSLLSAGGIDRRGRVIGGSRIDDAEVTAIARALGDAGFTSDATALRLTRELWRARHGVRAGRAPQVADTAPLEVRMLAFEVRAERAARAGADAQSRRIAAAGLDELTAWRSSFGSLDLQTSLAMHGNTLMLTGLGAAVRSGRPEVVFEWSERARHLSLAVVPLRPPADPEQAAELSELRMLRADAGGGEWTDEPRAIELGERLRRRQWTTTGAEGIENPVGLAEASAALDGDTALLSYVFSPAGLSCVVVTAAGATVVPLRGWNEARTDLPALRSDLDMSAAVRSGPMADVVRRSLADRLDRLSAVIVDGPLRGIDTARLVITAPGVLAGLPWTMLPGVQARAITVAASASRWVHGRRLGGRSGAGRSGYGRSGAGSAAAAVGSAAEPITRGDGPTFVVGPRVARGLEEAAAGASAWPHATLLAGADATVDAVTTAAGAARVLHLSAHGRHALDNPLFSGLQLHDGALFGYDIDRMATVPEVVVLSACEAGRSAVRWGEEAVGMTRAWLHAGVRAVIAAPVVVADDDACDLLGALHTGLAQGASPAVALADAAEHTGIRAPFLCHGNGF